MDVDDFFESSAASDGLLRLFLEGEDSAGHRVLQIEVAVGVDVVESILLQEVFSNHSSHFEGQLLVDRQSVGTDQLDDFLKFGLDLQQGADLGADLWEVRRDVVSVPLIERLWVERV